jgi:thioredoxin-dependent peroxiredoxin
VTSTTIEKNSRDTRRLPTRIERPGLDWSDSRLYRDMSESKHLEAGSVAPAFELIDQDGNAVKLSDFNGQKTIVYFYPAASTPGCTKQACDFRDHINSLKNEGYRVIGISPDKPAKLKKFQEKEGLNFPLLADEDNSVQQAYGAYGEKSMYGKTYMGTIRSTFVVDEAGKISHAFYNVKATGHVDFLRKQLGL